MIDWTCVPERFHYLQNPVLESRGGDLRISLYDEQTGRHIRPAETVTEEELPELIRVYHEICQREDNLAILEWIDEAQEAGDKECTEEVSKPLRY